MSPWTLARRAAGMNPSALREILHVTARPGMRSLAGGLPAPASFPVEALREASAKVLHDTPVDALQYAPSDGLPSLRERVASQLRARGASVQAEQVLITSGSQQGLDLIGKVLVEREEAVAVESPTYLGALQAFAPFEPVFRSVACDEEGPLPEALREFRRDCPGGRFFYTVPSFQNPTGRLMSATRRQTVVAVAEQAGLPLVEDDPYGELWYEAPAPAPLLAAWKDGVAYLGSFSKVLAPGLRLGYLVAPPALYPKLLQAKQAADLHSSGFLQRVVDEVLSSGVLPGHLDRVRGRYRLQRDAMQRALTRHLPSGCEWQLPQGGMFFWLRLPAGCDADALLPQAVAAQVAYVPGSVFFAERSDPRRLRLSFVTLSPAEIDVAVAALGEVVRCELRRRALR